VGLFCDYIASRFDSVKVFCYDTSEVDSIEKRDKKCGSRVVPIEIHHLSSYYAGDGHEFDVCIDDAYFEGSTVPFRPKSKWFSLKDQSSLCIPFLHRTEGRTFSHEFPGLASLCPCSVCRVVSSISVDYSDYTYLKAACVFLGGKSCNLVGYAKDIASKGELFSQLCSVPSVVVDQPRDIRSALALMTDVDVVALSFNTLQLRSLESGSPVPFVHTQGFIALENSEVCNRVLDCPVMFCGVDPSVLGSTRVVRGSFSSFDLHVFGRSSVAVFNQELTPRYLWVPDKTVIGYEPTAFQWRGYSCFQRLSHLRPRPLSYYSLVKGIDVRFCPSVLWTRQVPGSYWITRSQSEEVCPGLSDVHSDVLPYNLVDHFRVHASTGKVLPLSQNLPFVVDCDDGCYSPVVDPCVSSAWVLRSVNYRGGVAFVSPSSSTCFYQFSKGVVLCSQCDHDHLLRSGSQEIMVRSAKLSFVTVEEEWGGYVYPIIDTSFHYVKSHFERFRKGCVVTRLVGGKGVRIEISGCRIRRQGVG